VSAERSIYTVRVRRFLLAAVLVAIGTAPLFATIVIPAEFKEIITDATLIVRGHVTDTRPVRAGGSAIDTIATVAIDSLIKGQADGFVSVRLPGGEMGAYRSMTIGAPHLAVGDQAVLLLRRFSDGFWRPVGLSMGVYRVQAEPLTGRAVVPPPVMLNRTASRGAVLRGDARRTLLPVQEFESMIRLVVSAPKAVPR